LCRPVYRDLTDNARTTGKTIEADGSDDLAPEGEQQRMVRVVAFIGVVRVVDTKPPASAHHRSLGVLPVGRHGHLESLQIARIPAITMIVPKCHATLLSSLLLVVKAITTSARKATT
jgi:hypothetical protein